jgi:4-alpha-glucanotransferase
MDDSIERLAAAYGLQTRYTAIDGEMAEAPQEAVIALLEALGVEASNADARRQALGIAPQPPDTELRAPDGASCHQPDFLRRGRAWGVSCQLYGLRSRRNWGIGDLEDLARLGEMLATFGADFVGINPLHALFLAAPEHCSPFFPTSRTFLNPLYIAVDRIEGYRAGEDADETALNLLRQAPLIDYAAAAACKLVALRNIHARWKDAGGTTETLGFVREGGAELRRHALFQAIGLALVEEGHQAGWSSWPAPFRNPESPEVAEFARKQAASVDFQIWLQWIADAQLAEAAGRLRQAGMRIGLYLDLAVGSAPDGSATWSDRALSVVGVEIGAPPDMFNRSGQKWGLAPMSPTEIAARGCEPMRCTYDTVLRHAGALRIDHAMNVHRLFWIPSAFPASDGAYAIYPMKGIVQTLSDASQKHRAIIIGEDLGVVPDGFRREMKRAGMLGYRLFFFERGRQGFRPPETWPRHALACVGSHDTATLAGWWTGSDIATRRDIGLCDEADVERLREERGLERHQAMSLLRRHGVELPSARYSSQVAAGIHLLLARTPALLFVAQIEDLVGETDQPNIPGTVDEHPNWRRRLSVQLEDLAEHPVLQAVLSQIARERPRRP